MANPEITNIDQLDGVRGVEVSEQGILQLAGADTIARLTILSRQEVVLAITPAAGGTNTGNGTCTLATVTGPGVPKVGTWQFIMTAALVGNLVDPDGIIVASNIAIADGAAIVLNLGGLQFTITDGGTAFVADDYFDLPVVADGDYVPFALAGAGGAEIPLAVSLSEVVATGSGDFPLGVMLRGRVRESKLIIDGSAEGVGITDAIKDQLRDYGIIVEPATQTAELDNQ